MDKSKILSLPSKIIIKDKSYSDFDIIFDLLKSGVSLSMQVVYSFDGSPSYVLFLDRRFLEENND